MEGSSKNYATHVISNSLSLLKWSGFLVLLYQIWCNDNGHALQHIYIDEGYSASTMKRPQLQSMLSNLKNLDAIAFTRLDRLSRNVLEANKMLELLQQNNVAMISICEDDINTSTANGLFMFNLKVNLAEHELKKRL